MSWQSEPHHDSYGYEQIEELKDIIEQLNEKNNKSMRIACKAMQYIEDSEIEDFILLKDKEVREWWAEQKAARLQAARDKIKKLKTIIEISAVEATQVAKKAKIKEAELKKAEEELAAIN